MSSTERTEFGKKLTVYLAFTYEDDLVIADKLGMNLRILDGIKNGLYPAPKDKGVYERLSRLPNISWGVVEDLLHSKHGPDYLFEMTPKGVCSVDREKTFVSVYLSDTFESL